MFPTKLIYFSLLFWCKWCFLFEATKISTWVFLLPQSEPYKVATVCSNSWRDKRLKHKFWVLRLNHCLPSYKSQTHTYINWEFKNAFCIKTDWLFSRFYRTKSWRNNKLKQILGHVFLPLYPIKSRTVHCNIHWMKGRKIKLLMRIWWQRADIEISLLAVNVPHHGGWINDSQAKEL